MHKARYVVGTLKKRNMSTENQQLERENILYATKSASDLGEHPEAHIQLNKYLLSNY